MEAAKSCKDAERRHALEFGPPPAYRPEFPGLGSQGVIMDVAAWAGREFEKAAIRESKADACAPQVG
jgi:hypothetical protein